MSLNITQMINNIGGGQECVKLYGVGGAKVGVVGLGRPVLHGKF